MNGHHEEVKEKEPEMIIHAHTNVEPVKMPLAKTPGKLKPLYQYVDFNKSNIENGRILFEKGKEFSPAKYENDAAVDILDNIIKELGDVRKYLVSTTHENKSLKTRLDKFKKFLEE